MAAALPCSRWFPAVLLFLAASLTVAACPFCAKDGKTLASEVQDAAFVVYGRIANARTVANADGTETSTTELHITEVLKPHDFLQGKKMILLPRYLPLLDEKQPDKVIIFCYYYQGRIDPYLMFAVRDKQFLDYLRGSLGQKHENRTARLKFFFDHLDSENVEVSTDAYREFAFATFAEVRELVDKYRGTIREKLLPWMQNRDAQVARFGLFGLMLGLCGKPEDAAILRDALNDPQVVTGVDGMLAGYVMLDRKEGWAYLESILQDQKAVFHRRHAAMRTVKYFLKDDPGRVPVKSIWAAFGVLLESRDLSDYALAELRHAQNWSHLDRVLVLSQQESHQTPLIQKAILQYMLRCPEEKAKDYIAKMRQTIPKRVQSAEEDLLYDQPPP